MFTGIIEELGTIEEIKRGEISYELKIKGQKVLQDTKIGDSIAVNGICLTVKSMEEAHFLADVMGETLRRTSLSSLKKGDQVNLERALSLADRLGGHMVSGHVDGTGRITGKKAEDNAVWITIDTSPELLEMMVEKGSVAIDGISLTIVTVGSTFFQVSVIPHTGKETTLLKKPEGSLVNLECDIIGKYIQKFVGAKKEEPQLTQAFLAEYGFM